MNHLHYFEDGTLRVRLQISQIAEGSFEIAGYATDTSWWFEVFDTSSAPPVIQWFLDTLDRCGVQGRVETTIRHAKTFSPLPDVEAVSKKQKHE